MMDDFKDRLIFLKDSQNELMKEYQTLIEQYESNDLIHENQTLRNYYEEFKLQLSQLQEKYDQISEENVKLRNSLMEQILDEKLNIIKVSRKKLETYFEGRIKEHNNRLDAFEFDAKQKIRRLFERASIELEVEKDEFRAKLKQISSELDRKIILHREQRAEEEKTLIGNVKNGLDQFSSEEVNEEIIQKRIKQNQIEMKIGLNWINKLGILLIILGVGAAFKYSYSTWFNGYMKGSIFFLLGAVMLAGGEVFFRKQKQTFALGLLGGGISVLYGSIFYSYFLLHIIDIYVGLSLSILVSLTAVLLSLRYHSRTICSLGLVGGYLPLFSYMWAFGLHGNAVYTAMGYLFLLNLCILLVSFRKRWTIVNYISFLFNTPSLAALIWLANNESISILYSIITFLMYLGITLLYPFKYKSKLTRLDVVLLSLNTVTSCGLLYFLFDKAGLKDLRGILALIFSLVYIGLGKIIEKVLKKEKQTMLLFYATSLTFAILMIPFQFGIQWLSIGWLIEGILLSVYGSIYKFKQLTRAGWGIFLLCIGSFFVIDIGMNVFLDNTNDYFDFKYSAIIIGMSILTLFYAIRQNRSDVPLFSRPIELKIITWFKYFTLVNIWFYLMYEIDNVYSNNVSDQFTHYSFYHGLLQAFITIVFAYILTKIKVLYDSIVKYYCLFLYVIGYLICIYVTIQFPALKEDFSKNTFVEYIALVILIGVNIFVFFSSRDFLIAYIRRQFKSSELYPLILGIYLIGILTVFINIQLQLNKVGLAISLLYLLLAISYILYGFRKRYMYIRRLGLGLTLVSTGKLIFFDLSFLSSGSKIIAYFSFGIVLIGVSFIYQRVSLRLEEQHGQVDSKN